MKTEGMILIIFALLALGWLLMQTQPRQIVSEQVPTIVQPIWMTPEVYISDWDWPRGWSNRWWDSGPSVHPSRGYHSRPHPGPPNPVQPSPPPNPVQPSPPPNPVQPSPPPNPVPSSPPPAPPTTESFVGSPYPFA